MDSSWVGGQRGRRSRTSYARMGPLPPVQRAGSRSTGASSHRRSAMPGGGVGGDSDSDTVGRRSAGCQHSLISPGVRPTRRRLAAESNPTGQLHPESISTGKLERCRAYHGTWIPQVDRQAVELDSRESRRS